MLYYLIAAGSFGGVYALFAYIKVKILKNKKKENALFLILTKKHFNLANRLSYKLKL